jgi:hypothetical protein
MSEVVIGEIKGAMRKRESAIDLPRQKDDNIKEQYC